MDVSDIKSSVNILELASHLNIEVDPRTSRACCPFHDDKTPSLQFSQDKQIATCFSSNCDAGTMDVIKLVEKSKSLNTHHALKYLAHFSGGVISSEKEKGVKSIKQAPELNCKADFLQMQASFKSSTAAQRYLSDRGIVISSLRDEVGFNAKTGGLDYLKGCVVFPLKNKAGEVVSLYGRSISSDVNKHYYTANRKGLYPSFVSLETKRLILTESIIDAATLLQHDFITKNYEILALYGTNGLTDDHIASIGALKQLEDIILFFDGDDAGRAAGEKYQKEFLTRYPSVNVHVVPTPDGADVNELNQSHDSDVFSHLLGQVVGQNELADSNPGTGLITDRVDRIEYSNEYLKAVLLGGVSVHQVDRMRVTIKLCRTPQLSPLHSVRHSLDLYNDDQVEKLCRKAAERLETSTTELRQFMAEMIEKLEVYRLERLENAKVKKPQHRELTEVRKQLAMDYLQAPDLLKRTNADIEKSGLVGEEINRLLMYIVFTSRLREMPLHVISLGASGSGKTYLQERISELIPDDQKLEITTLSDNAFYYFGQHELQSKLILIEDMDGAENVLYPLRELMSKKRISKTLAMKDNKGNIKTITTVVEGPICVAGTTTREQIYEDNANRSLLIYLDGSNRQKELIMDYQRSVSAGQISYQTEQKAKDLLKDVQSLLKPIKVVNPYARDLKIPSEVFKPLRTNSHYLQFIECVTFYHQYQRAVKTTADGAEYIETTLDDIAMANELLNGVLISKADELTGACRLFFERLKVHLKSNDVTSFYAKDLRAELRMSYATLKRHLFALVQNGYVKVTGGDKYRKGYEYEVVSYEEYQTLQTNIKTALDQALEKIGGPGTGSVAQSGSVRQVSH